MIKILQLDFRAILALFDRCDSFFLLFRQLAGRRQADASIPVDGREVSPVGKGDGGQLLEHRLLGNFQLALELFLSFSDFFRNLRFSQVFIPDCFSSFCAVTGTFSGSRGVKIYQVLLNKSPLLI